jgi:hypothetical protein
VQAGTVRGQPLPQSGQVEDDVVGHDAEQQGDQEWLGLGRHGDAERAGHRASDVQRNQNRHARDGQRQQRRQQRPEGDGDDEEDGDEGGDLHRGHRRLGQPRLLHAGGDRPGNTDDVVVGPVVPLDEPLRSGVLVAEVHAGRHEQQRDDGGSTFARAGERAEGVGHRDRRDDRCDVRVLALRDRGRPQHRLCLGVRRQPGRIPLHHGDATEQGKAECAEGPDFRGDGWAAHRHEGDVATATTPLRQSGHEHHGSDTDREPAGDDRPAQPHHHPRIRPSGPVRMSVERAHGSPPDRTAE